MASIRNQIRAQFPNCVISIVAGEFDYLHHDDVSFGRRKLPCLHVAITSKEYAPNRDGRLVRADAGDPSAIVVKLRAAGLNAVVNVNAPGCVSVITTDDNPVNVVYGLGAR